MKKKPGLELRSESPSQSPTLRDLLARAERHQQAEAQVWQALPDSFAGKVRFVSVQEGEVTLSTETSALASQLRLRQHEVMEKLREQEDFRYVWRLKVKVMPPRFRDNTPREIVPLSNENARLLREEAGHTKDKALREVLEKLASHVRN